MALPTSGPISMDDVRNELGVGGSISLGQSSVRGLAGKPSGTISLANLRGKSAYNKWTHEITITGPRGSYNTAEYWFHWSYSKDRYEDPVPNTFEGGTISRFSLTTGRVQDNSNFDLKDAYLNDPSKFTKYCIMFYNCTTLSDGDMIRIGTRLGSVDLKVIRWASYLYLDGSVDKYDYVDTFGTYRPEVIDILRPVIVEARENYIPARIELRKL